jgi:hypothetical protein
MEVTIFRRYVIFKKVLMFDIETLAICRYQTELWEIGLNWEYHASDKVLFPKEYLFNKLDP